MDFVLSVVNWWWNCFHVTNRTTEILGQQATIGLHHAHAQIKHVPTDPAAGDYPLIYCNTIYKNWATEFNCENFGSHS